jgi:hypothetical protein
MCVCVCARTIHAYEREREREREEARIELCVSNLRNRIFLLERFNLYIASRGVCVNVGSALRLCRFRSCTNFITVGKSQSRVFYARERKPKDTAHNIQVLYSLCVSISLVEYLLSKEQYLIQTDTL